MSSPVSVIPTVSTGMRPRVMSGVGDNHASGCSISSWGVLEDEVASCVNVVEEPAKPPMAALQDSKLIPMALQ